MKLCATVLNLRLQYIVCSNVIHLEAASRSLVM